MHVCFLRKVAFKASGWIHRDYSSAHPGPFTISSSRMTVTCATDLEVIAAVQTSTLTALLSSLSTGVIVAIFNTRNRSLLGSIEKASLGLIC